MNERLVVMEEMISQSQEREILFNHKLLNVEYKCAQLESEVITLQEMIARLVRYSRKQFLICVKYIFGR